MAEIETRQLNKFYKNLHALKDINLGIKENELFGLLGVNGAGKTTLIKILTCLSEQTSGEAYVHGFSVKDNPEKVKEIVDVSPQETAVAHNLTVRENLDFFASLYNTRDEAYISSVVNAFSLEEVENQRAKTLSGGWTRWKICWTSSTVPWWKIPRQTLRTAVLSAQGSTPKWTSCGISCTAARASFLSWKPS